MLNFSGAPFTLYHSKLMRSAVTKISAFFKLSKVTVTLSIEVVIVILLTNGIECKCLQKLNTLAFSTNKLIVILSIEGTNRLECKCL